MKNINQYKNRFNQLLESTMGDVKPLISEQEKKGKVGIGMLNNFPISLTGKAQIKQLKQSDVEVSADVIGNPIDVQFFVGDSSPNINVILENFQMPSENGKLNLKITVSGFLLKKFNLNENPNKANDKIINNDTVMITFDDATLRERAPSNLYQFFIDCPNMESKELIIHVRTRNYTFA